jgi:hypothetical protein
MTRKQSVFLVAVLLLLACALLPSCLSDVGPDGTKHTAVLGVFDVSSEAPAPAGLTESLPWKDPLWVFRSPGERVALWDLWNVDHHYIPVEKPAGPVGDTSGVGGWIATGYALWLGLRTLGSKGGLANLAVVTDGDSSWKGTLLSVMHLLTGLGSSPPEAIGKRVAAEVPVAQAAAAASAPEVAPA